MLKHAILFLLPFVGLMSCKHADDAALKEARIVSDQPGEKFYQLEATHIQWRLYSCDNTSPIRCVRPNIIYREKYPNPYRSYGLAGSEDSTRAVFDRLYESEALIDAGIYPESWRGKPYPTSAPTKEDFFTQETEADFRKEKNLLIEFKEEKKNLEAFKAMGDGFFTADREQRLNTVNKAIETSNRQLMSMMKSTEQEHADAVLLYNSLPKREHVKIQINVAMTRMRDHKKFHHIIDNHGNLYLFKNIADEKPQKQTDDDLARRKKRKVGYRRVRSDGKPIESLTEQQLLVRVYRAFMHHGLKKAATAKGRETLEEEE